MQFVVNLLSRVSIKHKIWSGFGFVLGLLVFTVVLSLWNLSGNKKTVSVLVEDIQPTVMASMELMNHLNGAAGSLGFFLLSKEASHEKSYLETLTKIDADVERLQGAAQGNADLQARVARIAADIAQFKAYKDRMLELPRDNAKNLTAVAYSAENLNPLAMQMLQAASGMVSSESSETVSRSRRKLLLDIDELRYAWATVLNNVRVYMVVGDDAGLQNTRLYMERTAEMLEKIGAKGDMLTFEQEEYLAQFQESFDLFRQRLEKLVEIHKGDKVRMDAYLVRTAIGPLMATLHDELTDLVDEQKGRIERANAGMLSQISATIALVLGILVVALAFGVVVAWLLDRVTIRPLNVAVAAMSDIASGEGDLTKRLPAKGKDEIAQLANGFNAFVDKIRHLVGQNIEFIGQLADRVDRLGVVSQQTSAGADQQQRETEQVATAVNEMSTTVQEVARHASDAAQAAQGADQETEKGRQVVNHTVEVMDAVAREVDTAADVIHKLEAQSEDIGSVLDVIKTIAEQTNLLALNAAIEAARAGEQGRGFAVVADEVRTLASRTQESTLEIEETVERLQNGARDAVKAMEQGRDRARAGVEQAAAAGSSLESIAEAVGAINAMNAQIAQAAEQQAEVVEGINRNVVSISHVAEQNAAGAQQTYSAINELAALRDQLHQLMQQFRI